MGCQGGGGGNFDKRNVVLEFESLEAWVAKGGGECCQLGAKHGLPKGGGKNLIKGMLYSNLNY